MEKEYYNKIELIKLILSRCNKNMPENEQLSKRDIEIMIERNIKNNLIIPIF